MKLGTVIATQEIEQMAGGDVTAEASIEGGFTSLPKGSTSMALRGSGSCASCRARCSTVPPNSALRSGCSRG